MKLTMLDNTQIHYMKSGLLLLEDRWNQAVAEYKGTDDCVKIAYKKGIEIVDELIRTLNEEPVNVVIESDKTNQEGQDQQPTVTGTTVFTYRQT